MNYYGSTSGYVYLYSVGNPQTVYNGIEICQNRSNSIYQNNYITVQDLDFRYCSYYGPTLNLGGSTCKQRRTDC